MSGEVSSMHLKLGTKYMLFTGVIVIFLMGTVMGVIALRNEQIIIAQAEMQAKALFQHIVFLRNWVSDHRGVFVEELPWVRENPYLQQEPRVIRSMGKRYIRQNPATVTKELSQYAQKDRNYFFRITSLRLINPDNEPDDFERAALESFEKRKGTESSKVEKMGDSYYFRYIAPLSCEESCIECHMNQGYAAGDVMGAISVSVPMDSVFAMVRENRRFLVIGGVASVAALMTALLLMTRRMVINPISRIRDLMRKFSKDGDSDIPVISTQDELEELSRSFKEMATAIDSYHSCLQERIENATMELKEKNERLMKLNEMKSDSIAKVSHELRTPLTSIKGAMDYLSVRLSRLHSEDSAELLVFFEVIKKNAERLIRLVNNVIDYERIELGAFEMHFAEANLREIFGEVVLGFRSQALEKEVEITLEAQDVAAVVDEDRIRQVMINLLSNAIAFSPRASLVTVTLREADGNVQASVTDRGNGIDDHEREMIFHQFYSRGSKEGSGLGLAICRGIIEAHGGTIGVSSGPEAGSCFFFSIPRSGGAKGEDKGKPSCRR